MDEVEILREQVRELTIRVNNLTVERDIARARCDRLTGYVQEWRARYRTLKNQKASTHI